MDIIGQLPLLNAILYCGSSGFLEMLFKAYPHSAKVQDSVGDLPLLHIT